MIREIVTIDEEKCDGCGLCVPACAEGAIRIVDGKAKLIADNLCDGLGACLGHCPKDAIVIEKRDAALFDEAAVEKHLHGDIGNEAAKPHGGCPSARVQSVQRQTAANTDAGRRASELRQWPVQMHLVPPSAPFLRQTDLLLAADCVAFAHAEFHRDLLQGKALLIGCPKLDDGRAYLEKLTAILAQNDIKSLTVAFMEVPCCSGLVQVARQAIAASGKEVPLHLTRVGIDGERK